MKSKELTWEELADMISKMSSEEKKESVKVWHEDGLICSGVCLCKENQDMCYYKKYEDEGCDLRGNLDQNEELIVALEKEKFYLWA